MRAFPKITSRVGSAPPKIDDATLSDFSGGLKITDNELNLKPRYATRLVNMFADNDNSQVLRFGTKQYCALPDVIVNLMEFRRNLIAVLVNGDVYKVDENGVSTVIWNDAIANALPGNPSGWSTGLEYADFSEFRGELVIVNGVDKPILVDAVFNVTYLQDKATGSNVFTPVTRFVRTISNYCVMAGDPNDPTTIYVSSTGTSGTWPGDADPNDAISFDVGAYSGRASTEILAIGNFKNLLVVYFEDFATIFQLGVFSEGVHNPSVVDTYSHIGTVNYKTTITTESDLLFPAKEGVISAAKNVFGGTLDTKGISEDLGTDYNKILGNVDYNELDCFAVIDILSKTMMFSFKLTDNSFAIIAFRHNENMTKISWTTFEGWSFTSACATEKGRVFLVQAGIIYQYGNDAFTGEEYYADYITDSYEGSEIEFEWEMPWLDAGNRIKSKRLARIAFDTQGSAAFSLQCFVNRYYTDINDDFDPAAEMNFVAGDSSGYGAAGYGTGGYGGGRRANDERFYGFPLKFRVLKMRIYGKTREPLSIVTISLIYLRGNYNA